MPCQRFLPFCSKSSVVTKLDLVDVGSTPLVVAAACGYEEMTAWLLNEGAGLQATDNQNRDALSMGTRICNLRVRVRDHTAVVRLLLLRGANITHQEQNGFTPMMLASSSWAS